MGLKTPDKIRTFQRKLYLKAKAEPDFRSTFFTTRSIGRIFSAHAYRLARANGGISGVDGVTFEQIESEGLMSGYQAPESNYAQRRTNHNRCDG